MPHNNNIHVFDPRDAYVRGQGNSHDGCESNRGDGSAYAEFMRGNLDGTELDGNRVDYRDHGCERGWDLDCEHVYDHYHGDTQHTMDQLSDNEYNYNTPCFDDYNILNSQDSRAISNSKH